MPDDYKYEFIKESLENIFEAETDFEDIQMEADVYTKDLLNWLASNTNRVCYMEEAIEYTNEFEQFTNHLMAAQSLEKQEVLGLVLTALEKLV